MINLVSRNGDHFCREALGTSLRYMTHYRELLWSYLNGPQLIGLLTLECPKGNLNANNQCDLVVGDYDFSLILPKC